MKIPVPHSRDNRNIVTLDTKSKHSLRSDSSPLSPNFISTMNGSGNENGKLKTMEEIISNFMIHFPVLNSQESEDLQTTSFTSHKLEVCSLDDIPNWEIKEISIEKGVIRNMNFLDLNMCKFRLLWDFADLHQIASSFGRNIDHINGGNEFADVPFFCLSYDNDFMSNDIYLIRALDRTLFMKFFLQLSFWTNMGQEGILERYTTVKKTDISNDSLIGGFTSVKSKCFFEGENLKNSSRWLHCDISISDDSNMLSFCFDDPNSNFYINLTEILESEISTLDPSLAQNGEKLLNIKILPALRKQYCLHDVDWFSEMGIPHNIIIKFTTYCNFLKVFFILKKNSIKEVLTDHLNKMNCLRLNHHVNLNIIEAELDNISLYSSPIYIEVCIYDTVFARTNKVESTYGQLFWREEVNIKCNLNLENIVLKLKLEKNDTVIGYIDIESFYLYNNDYKIVRKELKLPIYQPSSNTYGARKPIGQLLVSLKHEWNFVLPSVQYYAIMDIFKQIKMEFLVQYIYRDNKIDNDVILFDIGKSILNILSFYGRANQYLNQCIETEINDTIEVLILRKTLQSANETANGNNNHIFNTIFRGNSLVTKMLESHFNKAGSEYLFQIFQPILKKIYTDNLNLEMDPKRLKRNMKNIESEEQLEEILDNNYHKICEYLNEIWNIIYTTSMDLPQNIKLQLKFIRTNLELFSVHGLDEEQLSILIMNCISSFIFLRFFIPIILNPKIFNIMNDSPNETQRRTLTLVSKILLNISTQTKFEIKDPFLNKFNSFISSKREEVFNYYDKVTEKILDFTSKKYDFLVWKNNESLVNKYENDSVELQCSKLIDFIIENDLNSKNFISESKFLYDVKSLVYKKDVVIQMPKILQTRDILNSSMDDMPDFTFSKRLNTKSQTVYAIGELSFENELNDNKKDDFGEKMFELLGLGDSENNTENNESSKMRSVVEIKNSSKENSLNVELTQLFSECHILYSKKTRILSSFQQKEICKRNLLNFMRLELIPNLVYDLNTKVISLSDNETILKSNRKNCRVIFKTEAMSELILGSYVLYGVRQEKIGEKSNILKDKNAKTIKQNKSSTGSRVLSRSFSKFFGKR